MIFDYKKAYPDLYLPKAKPELTDVPLMKFIMVDGKGNPGSKSYQDAIAVLYALSYTIKMSKMGGKQPANYFEYVVPPLEGLWWGEKGTFDKNNPDSWLWTAMIRQPEFVNNRVFEWAKEETASKKTELDLRSACFEEFSEGWCVQMMHIGPYSEEEKTIAQMQQFIAEKGYKNMTGDQCKHHEIYLSDPRKIAPEKLKTVIRVPVKLS